MCAGFVAPLLKFWAAAWNAGLLAQAAPELLLVGALLASIAGWWLPGTWYDIRPFEERGRVYERLGVLLFRRLVPNGDWVNAWRRRHNPAFRVIVNRDTAHQLRQRTIAGEKSHVVLFGITTVSAAYAWWIGWSGWAIYLAIANVPANLYPILLQRYTRARLRRSRSSVTRCEKSAAF